MGRFLLLWLQRAYARDRIGTSIVLLGIALCTSAFFAIHATARLSTERFSEILLPFGSPNVASLRMRSESFVGGNAERPGIGAFIEEEFTLIPYEQRSILLEGNDGSRERLPLYLSWSPLLSPDTLYVPSLLYEELLERPVSLLNGGVREPFVFELLPTELERHFGAEQRSVLGFARELSACAATQALVIREEKSPGFFALQQLIAELGDGLALIDRSAAVSIAGHLSRAFQRNVFILVLAGLLITCFLAYQLFSLRVVALASEFQTLRTLGLSRSQLVLLVLSEAILIGVVGALIGLTLLAPMSHLLSVIYQSAIFALYAGGASSDSLALQYSWSSLLVSIAVAALIAMVGALVPALRLLRVQGGLSQHTHGTSLQRALPLSRISIQWLLLCASSAVLIVCCLQAQKHSDIRFAYAAAALLVPLSFSLVALVGEMVFPLLRRVAALPRLGLVLLSFAWLRASAVEVGRAAGVTALAFCLTFAMSAMISSFRAVVQQWARTTLVADVYIRPQMPDARSSISEEFITALAAQQEIAELYPSRFAFVLQESRPLTIVGIDFELAAKKGIHTFLAGSYPSHEQGLLTTEATARKRGLVVGDRVSIEGKAYTVSGIIQDFSSEHDLFYLSHAEFLKLFGLQPVAALGVFLALQPDTSLDTAALIERLITLPGGQELEFFSNRGLREQVDEIFDGTFQITIFLRFVLLFVAALGLAILLVQNVALRTDELRTLVASGASRLQLRCALLVESISVAVIAGIAGTGSGFLLAYILTELVTPLAFGWSIGSVELSLSDSTASWFAVLAAALIAVVIPAKQVTLMTRGKQERGYEEVD